MEVIPEEQFREALAACCRDPKLNEYYERAPAGARLYVALRFWATHYGDRVDPSVYAQCLSEIEPDLRPGDLAYLFEHETDAAVRRYFMDVARAKGFSIPCMARALAARRASRVVPAPQSEPEGELAKMTLKPVQGVWHEANLYEQNLVSVTEQHQAAQIARKLQARHEALVGFFVKGALLAVLLLIAGVCGWWLFFGKGRAPVSRKASDFMDASEEGTARQSALLPLPVARAVVTQSVVQVEETPIAVRQFQQPRPAVGTRSVGSTNAVSRSEDVVKLETGAAKTNVATLERMLRAATFDYWKNASADWRPKNVKTPTTYYGLVPLSDKTPLWMQIDCAPGGKLTVWRLSANASPESLSDAAFKSLTTGVDYVIFREDRAYFCSSSAAREETYAVPKAGEAFNPAAKDFGELYPVLERLRVDVSKTLFYTVVFRLYGSRREYVVGETSYGSDFTRAAIKKCVWDALNKDAASAAVKNAAKAKFKKETGFDRHRVVFGPSARIVKRIDGTIEVPRTFDGYIYEYKNRHADVPGRTIYRSRNLEGWRETAQYREWRRLVDEAKRQEAEEEKIQSALNAARFATVSERDVENALNTGVLFYRAQTRK